MSDRPCIAIFALRDSAAAASLADAPLQYPRRVRCRSSSAAAAAAFLIVPITYIIIRTYSRLCDLHTRMSYDVHFSDATITTDDIRDYRLPTFIYTFIQFFINIIK